MSENAKQPLVGIIMGSQSDLSTLCEAAKLLEELEIPHETKIVSAHRTGRLYEYAETAEERGSKSSLPVPVARPAYPA